MTHPSFLVSSSLVPDRLVQLWAEIESGKRPQDDLLRMQERWLDEYQLTWRDALLLPGAADLPASICTEISTILQVDDPAEVRRRCQAAVLAMKQEWEETVTGEKDSEVIEYYDRSQSYSYELMWWHSLDEDLSPLAYVSALHLALKEPGRAYLDFGAGVGSGGILFARHGFEVSLADISSTLQDFARRRLESRGVPACYLDLKSQSLPSQAYDFVTAMDVFEHIAHPEEAVHQLAPAIRPGGILFGRFSSEDDPDRPSHIARDFGPAFQALEALGFEECWRDKWLWGHQAFQRVRS